MKRLLHLCILLALICSTASAQMKDTLRVLCIGNSFTYVGDAHKKLVELAASQGHFIRMNAQYVGGFTFARHLQRDETLNAIERPSPADAFDYVFLQNQSQLHARYGSNPKQYPYVLADAKELSGRIRQYSPKAVIFIESTWSYPAGGFGGSLLASASARWKPSTACPTRVLKPWRRPARPRCPISGAPSPWPGNSARRSLCWQTTPNTKQTLDHISRPV